MRKLVLIAAMMLMATASAHAGGYSFNVQGQKVRINVPRGCTSLNCIAVSAPGLEEKFKNRNKDNDEDTSSKPVSTTTATAPAAAPAPAPAPVAAVTPVTNYPAPAPAPAMSTDTSTRITVLTAPEAAPVSTTTTGSTLTAPQVSLPPAPAAAPAPIQVAAAPAAAVPAPAAPAVQASDSPIGVWLSEKKEGKIRIEDCNGNLCGYAMDAKTGANGEKVLINMKPRGNQWAGRIHDTRSGGNYDSTITLRGTDKLKVQGCALGGMFCGGETWTRVE